MPKTVIKVYFNNGCTTLIYTDSTSAEDIARLVIKGRLSLNELRYKQCFQIRAARFSLPIKDFDPLFFTAKDSEKNEKSSNTDKKKLEIEEFFWLKKDDLIKDWIQSIESSEEPNKTLDYWMLQLRIRYLSTDLNEIKFKDPVTFNYYYEQVKNDFIFEIASKIKNTELIPSLLDLGCLEMRRAFQNMNPNVLDKKINYEYLEKDVGLKRFFPDIVLNQKTKSIKKLIIKGLKVHENLNEVECMLKYLEKLKVLWKFNEETYNCNLGITWGVPITVTIGYDSEIFCTMNNSKEPFQNAKFDKITEIITELDESQQKGLLKLRIVDAKEPLVFRFESLKEADNMASIIDGYCCLKNKSTDSKWIKTPVLPDLKAFNRNSFDKSSLVDKISHSNSQEFNKSIFTRTANSAHILSESDDLGTSASSIDTNSIVGSANELLIGENLKTNEIKAESLTFCEKLGSGQFGDVFRGTYKKNANAYVEVAIKQLKISEAADNLDVDDHTIIAKKFMREAKIMEKFDHSHIIKLIGICTEGPLLIVMELAKFGQLRNYLQNNKDHIETSSLLLYCYQLSSAMAYLESKKFVHRDIAARNVLVANHESIKLSDFGLSREIDDIYLASKCKLPIKWMAPESINFRKFTSHSDVWMYGICVWEILSYGNKPFQGIKNQDVIKLIENKTRLQQPSNCSDELYSLLLNCWEYDSSARPNFTTVKETINAIHTKSKDNKSTGKTLGIIINSSLSNGSSYLSNSSTSSSVSSGNNISLTEQAHNPPNLTNESNNKTVTMMMMMPLDKSAKSLETTLAAVTAAANHNPLYTSPNTSLSSPPPKPNRLNPNFSLADTFSPTHTSSAQLICKQNYCFQKSANNPNRTEFDEDISAIILNRDDVEHANSANLLNLHSPTYSLTKSGTNSSNNSKCSQHDSSSASEKKQTNLLSSKQNDYLWLDEKFKSMGIDKKENKSPPTCSNAYPVSELKQSVQHQQSGLPNQTDLILRDQTLIFIQAISSFIRYLNTDNHKLDSELKSIVVSLNRLIDTINGIKINNQAKKLKASKVNELEKFLGQMIEELKENHVENVINIALELARKANELFLAIAKPVATV